MWYAGIIINNNMNEMYIGIINTLDWAAIKRGTKPYASIELKNLTPEEDIIIYNRI